MPFSGLAPSKLKIKKKIRVGYVYIEESFDTIYIMGYGLRRIFRRLHRNIKQYRNIFFKILALDFLEA